MNRERVAAASIIFEGKMWVTGGSDKALRPIASTELIDPHELNMVSSLANISNSYSAKKPQIFYIDLPEAISYHSIIRLNYTTSFLIAGQTETSDQTDKTYYFHHTTNTWTNGPHLTTRRRFHTAGVIKDRVTFTEHVVVAGGVDSHEEMIDSVEIMFNNENKWTPGKVI